MKKIVLIISVCYLSFSSFSQSLYFPPLLGSTWETTDPIALGWRADKIDSLYQYLENQNTKAFIVLKDGKIVLEKYYGTFTKDSSWYWASAGKTLTSFLVGKAQEDGILKITDTTSKYLGNGWTGCTTEQENKITIWHQLTMTTGLDDGVTDNHCTTPSCLQYLTEPGARWAYHNAPYTLLRDVLANASGVNENTYIYQKLKSKTGMNGLWITSDYDNVFYSTPRSMARYGLLIQNNCIWNTDTLLHDTAYIKQMTKTSQDINKSYGYLWWLNGKESFMIPSLQLVFSGSYAPHAPDDMYAALGKNGQILCIVPSQGLVVLRMGNSSEDATAVPLKLCDSIWKKLSIAMCVNSSAQLPIVKPSVPKQSFTNKTIFNEVTKQFDFIYQGQDGTLKYSYYPQYSGSLSALKCLADDTYEFSPSSCGGLTMMADNQEVFPWSANVSYEISALHTNADTLYISWKMGYNSTFLNYTYRMYIAGRSLEIKVDATETNATAFVLDRTDKTPNAYSISIPYLPTMNVLLSNNYFLSAFFDWENTNASELSPLYGSFSSESFYFAQNARYFPKTNGQRNAVHEKIYFTVSPNIDQVLPHLPNPVSTYKKESSERMVLDIWEWPFNTCRNFVEQCYQAGLSNLWVIHHNWQNAGYDNKYPDVLPANPIHGGNADLKTYSDTVLAHGDLFALHENYVDIYPNTVSWNSSHIALNSDGSQTKAWYNGDYNVQSYLLKPSLIKQYADIFSPQIHSTFNTNACFLDVHSSVNPAGKTDYDANVDSSAMMLQTMHLYRNIASTLRKYHNGPVSGEGYCHFMYAGYFDDFEPQINTAALDPGVMQGYRLPLFVNFKLNEMHQQTAMHGAGYLERFYSNTDGSSNFTQRTKDEVMTYMATELAYGNCSYIATPGRFINFMEAAKLEYDYVYSTQNLYSNATPVSIVYNDNGTELDLSAYIKKYPSTFQDINNNNFLSQVKITYDNGTVIYVNRHPAKTWQVDVSGINGWFNYHAKINNKDTLFTGMTSGQNITLPANNGWLVYSITTSNTKNNISKNKNSFNIYPNPVASQLTVVSNQLSEIKIINVYGQSVLRLMPENQQPTTTINICKLTPGLYFVKIGNEVQKFIKH